MSQTTLEHQTEQNTTSIKLIQQDLGYMKQGIDDIKSDIKGLSESIRDGYTKKEEFVALDSRVKSMENLKDWALKIVVGAIIVSLLAFIGIKQ